MQTFSSFFKMENPTIECSPQQKQIQSLITIPVNTSYNENVCKIYNLS